MATSAPSTNAARRHRPGRRAFAVIVALAVLLGGCAGSPAITPAQCPTPVSDTRPPPGSYANGGLHIDYDKLVPPGNPRRGMDMAYGRRVVVDPALLEQVYHDAAHGNPRAAWLVCELEASAHSGGRQVARYLASARCRTVMDCGARWSDLPFSRDTASGQRLLGELAAGFHDQAQQLQLADELLASSLHVLVGAHLAARILSASAPRVLSRAPGPLSAADQAVLARVRVPGPVRSFGSFTSLKRQLGPAGTGKQWHHVVEQTPGNMARFGPKALHTTTNVIRIDASAHRAISGFYSSKVPAVSGRMTVRTWLSTQSFEQQRTFGIQILRDYGVIP